MAYEQNIATIYVQLDALLDTRIGTLSRINPAVVEDLITNGYCSRSVDHFDGVDMEAYRALYAQRNEETLIHALPTEMINVLREMVDVLSEQSITSPYHKGVKVVVNVHPYSLSAENKVTIQETVTQWIQALAPVEIVTLSDEDLTPEHIYATYTTMIMYDWCNWLKVQAQAFNDRPCNGVVLYVPQIHFFANGETYREDIKKMTEEIANPMDALKLITAQMFTLELTDTSVFSILQNRHTSPPSTRAPV